MTYGIKLHIWGERACFTRPEMKAERVSYDVITPSAARGVLEAIYWKPAIRWVIDFIQVLKPIQFESLRRNEVGDKILINKVSSAKKTAALNGLHHSVTADRVQRATTLLKNVAYLIQAHIEMTESADADDSVSKHLDIFNRRARKGQCFHWPCLGTREFPAAFELIEGDRATPSPDPSLKGQQALGWMLHDIDFNNNRMPHFFKAVMQDGLIQVPPFKVTEVTA